MKLLEALEILNRPVVAAGSAREISLSCSFTPLHLQTFLESHLRTHLPTNRIQIKTGLYGDLAGNLERLEKARGSETCVVVEWGDLDPRLGIRSLGNWRSGDIPEIVESARRQSERLIYLIRRAAELGPVYVCSPTLPLPPIFTTRAAQAHQDECKVREIAGSLWAALSASRQVKVISSQRLDELSPLSRRFDPKAEMSSGFPYNLEHASTLAGLFAALKARSFLAAVNGPPQPVGHRVNLTLRELAQPAVLRHGGFPLFPRTNAEYIKKQDIACGLFFGRPAFIAGHHDIAKQPAALVEAVSMINSIAPGIRWCGLESAIINSALRRKTPDGAYHFRAYSGAARLTNDREFPQRFTVEWDLPAESPPVEHILRDGASDRSFEAKGSTVRLSTEVGPHNSVTVSPIYRDDFTGLEGLGLWWDAKAMIRRRLSEVRDNYIGRLRHWLLTRCGPSARQ